MNDDHDRGGPPVTPTEKSLAEMWGGLLGVDGIDVNDHFLDLGGRSIAATRALMAIENRFGLDLPFSAILGDDGKLRSIAALIDRLIRQRTQESPHAPVRDR
jgi:acyl carrier protein